MRHLLRYLFKTYRQFFYDLILEDLYGQIPKNISDPGISVLAADRAKVDRWLMWQALVLQRRLLHNPQEANPIMGMLLQIKMTSFILSGNIIVDNKIDGLTPAAKARADREKAQTVTLESAVEGVGRFMRRDTAKKEE